MRIQHFKLNEQGLNHFFGPLEAQVMDIVWVHEQVSIKQVHEVVCKEKGLSFNTVMTVMNRLVEKGYLKKKRVIKGYIYKAVQNKEEFLQEQTKEMTRELVGEFGDLMVNHMVEALEEASPELLEKLEEKLNQIKRRR